MRVLYRQINLTLEQCKDIVKEYNKGIPVVKIAYSYQRSTKTIYDILKKMRNSGDPAPISRYLKPGIQLNEI